MPGLLLRAALLVGAYVGLRALLDGSRPRLEAGEAARERNGGRRDAAQPRAAGPRPERGARTTRTRLPGLGEGTSRGWPAWPGDERLFEGGAHSADRLEAAYASTALDGIWNEPDEPAGSERDAPVVTRGASALREGTGR